MPKALRRKPTLHLALELSIDGESILTMESSAMNGIKDVELYETEIRMAIEWLKGFIKDESKAIT